jgi:class 3 adenylate cyclase
MNRVKSVQFTDRASRAKHGLVLIGDLEGFSRFFNQPDVNDYVSKFLNHVFEAVNVCLAGGEAYWSEDKTYLPLEIQPSHVKFLGDGAMYIWTMDSHSSDFSQLTIQRLCNRLWHLKHGFNKVLIKSADDVPVFDLPPRIRFGLARGTVFELRHKNSAQTEYIGFCINLASRLQTYCPQLGFIASARLGLAKSILEKNNYIKVVAKKIKGFSNEIVIVAKAEFNRLDQEIKEELFDPID